MGQPFRHVTLVFHTFGDGHFVEEGAAQAVGEPGDKEGMADAGVRFSRSRNRNGE